jgi:hypothetical protein
MNKIPTAEEFLKQYELGNTGKMDIEDAKEAIIEFAKLHVEAALKSASENAYVEYIDLDTNEIFDYTDVITDDNVGADVNKNSILNAYSLENI